MDSYYQILGIEQTADEGAIKRAYFKAVRRYPPDKAAEEFKQVREAYEVLMDQERRALYDRTMWLDDAMLDTYRNTVTCIDMENYEEAAQNCEAVLRMSDEEVFEALLGEIYLLNGNSGKAAKQFEMLCNKHPEKTEYKKWMINSYRERTWNKKALGAMREIEAECGAEADFLTLQGNVFCGLQLYTEAAEKFGAARKAFQDGAGWNDHFLERLWLTLARRFQEIPEAVIGNVISAYSAYANSYGKKKQALAPSLMVMIKLLAQCDFDVDITELEGLLEMAGEWEKNGKLAYSGRWNLMIVERELEQLKLNRDGRIRELIRTGADLMYSSYLMKESINMADEGLEQQYLSMKMKEEVEPLIAEMRLCMIHELPGIKKEMVIIKEEYPKLAEAFGDFIDEIIRNNSRAFLLNKYEKKIKRSLVDKMADMPDLFGYDDCGNGLFEDDFDADDMDYDWTETAKPYRRETPKIGRNAPCPCGSGKKYKNCCGKS